ncbi:MAG: hypothetical protein KKC77_06785, partial [Proteobacteria bacterium]|nr:hypothetical protein [Pseudomonadota bacterium]
ENNMRCGLSSIHFPAESLFRVATESNTPQVRQRIQALGEKAAAMTPKAWQPARTEKYPRARLSS